LLNADGGRHPYQQQLSTRPLELKLAVTLTYALYSVQNDILPSAVHPSSLILVFLISPLFAAGLEVTSAWPIGSTQLSCTRLPDPH
jgi:hypothetical protein